MRTLQNYRKFPWEGCGFSVRSVQINIVLASWFPWFRGIHRTRLEKAFLTDSRPCEIQPETFFMFKKNQPELNICASPPFFCLHWE